MHKWQLGLIISAIAGVIAAIVAVAMLVGLYLHGSLALDDIVAGNSDVDLCAVVPELRDDQRQRVWRKQNPTSASASVGRRENPISPRVLGHEVGH